MRKFSRIGKLACICVRAGANLLWFFPTELTSSRYFRIHFQYQPRNHSHPSCWSFSEKKKFFSHQFWTFSLIRDRERNRRLFRSYRGRDRKQFFKGKNNFCAFCSLLWRGLENKVKKKKILQEFRSLRKKLEFTLCDIFYVRGENLTNLQQTKSESANNKKNT